MQEIIVANNTKVPVKCMGNVSIQTKVKNQLHDIVIHKVLCVPELTTNLLSVSQLIKNGNSVCFQKNGCEIYNKNQVLIAIADLVDNVYRLNVHKLNAETCNLVTANIWHRRLGHINFADLKKMSSGVVNGMDCSQKIQKQECIVCCEGKQSRLSFKHVGTRANELLEVIHGDVCGPMEVVSIGGSRYFLILEDDYSRMCFIYFLKTKDEVFKCFKEFKIMVETQKNKKIKIFRTDNGGEFCGNEFEKFLRNSGIIHQTTNPYTPEQNGLSERLNRTVVEKGRCLLFDAKLEKKFWAEAVNTAAYLRNRSIAAGLNNKTPYEVWNDLKPDLRHLKIFGSTVMVHVPQNKRRKFDKKSEKMILVGYGETVKGYRLYNPQTNSVITSRDVVIMEDVKKEVLVRLDYEKEDDTGSDNPKTEPIPPEIETENNKFEQEELRDLVGETHEEEDDLRDSDFVPNCNEEVVTSSEVRRSTRPTKVKNYDDYVTYLCSSVNQENIDLNSDPVNVKEALSRPDGENWRKAMEDELDSFRENEAWDLVEPPENTVIVGNKWVFKKKFNNNGDVCYRARLVARGFVQQEGVDYDETFAPVVRHSTNVNSIIYKT